jgi:hypothetical protein
MKVKVIRKKAKGGATPNGQLYLATVSIELLPFTFKLFT